MPTSFSAPGWSRMTRLSVERRHGERHAGRHVGLDHAGDHVDRRPLGGDDQVDAHGARLLGDAGDLLHVARRDHHQVVELVDDDDDVRHPVERAGVLALLLPQVATVERCVVPADVAEADLGQHVVAPSISLHAHCRALAAFFGLVTGWVSRCGSRLY